MVNQKICFNPCSIGNCSGSYLLGQSIKKPNRVSILVLLEIALEVEAEEVLKRIWVVSILVLLEIALEECTSS